MVSTLHLTLRGLLYELPEEYKKQFSETFYIVMGHRVRGPNVVNCISSIHIN